MSAFIVAFGWQVVSMRLAPWGMEVRGKRDSYWVISWYEIAFVLDLGAASVFVDV